MLPSLRMVKVFKLSTVEIKTRKVPSLKFLFLPFSGMLQLFGAGLPWEV